MKNIIVAAFTIFLLASCNEQTVDNPPPSSYQLQQNYPNPFTDTTVIEYSVPVVSSSWAQHIRISVYDRFLDRQIILLDSTNHPAGIFRLTWKPYQKNPSGLYYIELEHYTGTSIGSTPETITVKRITAIKK